MENNKSSIFRKSNGDLNGAVIGIVVGVAFVLVVMLVMFISEFYKIVDPVHGGIVVKGGKLQEEALPNGFYFKIPFWTDIYPVFTGTLSTDDDAVKGEEGEFKEDNPYRNIKPRSKDGQILTVDVQLNYSVVDVKKFYSKTGSTSPQKIEQLYIIPKIRAYIKEMTPEYGWKALILEGERVELGQRVAAAIMDGTLQRRVCESEQKSTDEKTGIETIIEENCKLIDRENSTDKPSDFGVLISSVNFKDIRPSVEIDHAIAKALAKEQEVKVAKQQAEIAKANADEQFNRQDGVSRSNEREAEAIAYKIRIEKEEEAKGIIALAAANRELNEALKGSEKLIEFKRLEIEQTNADANHEYARHYTGQVAQNVTIIGTDEAKDAKLLIGIPSITVQE